MGNTKEESGKNWAKHEKRGFDSGTGVYHSLFQLLGDHSIPTRADLDTASFVLAHFPQQHQAHRQVALIDAATNQKITYSQLERSIRALASGLYHAVGIRKGDVVFVLAPNSLTYPIIGLAILSLGAILTPANPLNTSSEITKQVCDSGAKLIISVSEELHKFTQTQVPIIDVSRQSNSELLSIEELIECCDPQELPKMELYQSETAAILYSSGTTGISKGVLLTHENFIAILTILKWSVYKTSSQNDVFLCFLPMFHMYGVMFFVVGLFCIGITSVIMQKFDLQAMLDAIKTYHVNHIPMVPPVILALVKYSSDAREELSSLRRIISGAAPLSKELANAFIEKFPWVELRQGYGLTEICGVATFALRMDQAKLHKGSCGMLLPSFCAKVIDTETGLALPPYKKGELWLKSPTVMKGYLGNEEATTATIDNDGWLRTGDLGYFDEDGFVYIVDRIKELIKHNGYQVFS